MIRSASLAGVLLLVLVAVGCSSESSSPDRSSVNGSTDGGTRDADAAPVTPDPNQGRDSDAASCFAACQNSAFDCQAKSASGTVTTVADLVLDAEGCTGTLTFDAGTPNEKVVAMKLHCGDRKVCTGDAPGQPPTSCVPGLFSAFSFAYTPSSGAENVCTRS